MSNQSKIKVYSVSESGILGFSPLLLDSDKQNPDGMVMVGDYIALRGQLEHALHEVIKLKNQIEGLKVSQEALSNLLKEQRRMLDEQGRLITVQRDIMNGLRQVEKDQASIICGMKPSVEDDVHAAIKTVAKEVMAPALINKLLGYDLGDVIKEVAQNIGKKDDSVGECAEVDEDGWHTWHGGMFRPVDGNQVVDVMYKDGTISTNRVADSIIFDWSKASSEYEGRKVVAWRESKVIDWRNVVACRDDKKPMEYNADLSEKLTQFTIIERDKDGNQKSKWSILFSNLKDANAWCKWMNETYCKDGGYFFVADQCEDGVCGWHAWNGVGRPQEVEDAIVDVKLNNGEILAERRGSELIFNWADLKEWKDEFKIVAWRFTPDATDDWE